MPNAEKNLQTFNEAELKLEPRLRSVFMQAMIGGLATVVDNKTWAGIVSISVATLQTTQGKK